MSANDQSLIANNAFSPATGSTTNPPRFDITGGNLQVTDDGTALKAYNKPFNFNPYNVFQVPFKRFNMFGQARYEVADGIEVYARGMYSNNTVDTVIAPSGVFGSSVVVPVSNPFMTAAQRATLCARAGINVNAADPTKTPFNPVTGGAPYTAAECAAAATATSTSDPAYRTLTFGLRWRAVEVGPRISDYNSQVFDMRAGVRGDITDNIHFDVSGAHGESKKLQTIQNYVLLSRVRQALLATNPNSCLNTANGCVPLNIFQPGSVSAAVADFINDNATTQVNTKLDQVKGVISGDTGIASPWASDGINFALGTEYRRYYAEQASDALAKTAGELGGAGGAAPDIKGGYEVFEGFGELIVPLAQDKPLMHELSVEAGIRQSHYKIDATGKPTYDATTWKVAGTWAPVPDLKIRGNYQRAVRAPNIGELFSPVTTGLTNLGSDPCAGIAPTANANLKAVCLAQGAPASTIGSINNPTAGQANITTGGNTKVGPETATTWTVGAVVTPSMLPGFSASLDYYNIKVTDAITTPTPADLMNACFSGLDNNSATKAACTVIRRNPISGALDGPPDTTFGLFGVLSNLGVLKTRGFDLNMNYSRDIGTLLGQPSRVSLSFNGNHTITSKFQATPTSIDRECVGMYSVNCSSIQPTWAFNTRATLTLGPVDVSLLWRHYARAKLEDDVMANDLAAAEQANVDYRAIAKNHVGGDLKAALIGGESSLPCYDYANSDAGGCVIDKRFRKIPRYDYFDLTTRFDVTKNFEMTLTVMNLFDKKPPVVGGTAGTTSQNGGNTYPSSYDALGRRFAVSAKVKF